MASSSAEVVLGTKREKPKGAPRVTEMHIRPAHKGGYIVRHDRAHRNGMPAAGEEHVVPNKAALQEHMEQYLPGAAGEQPDPSQGMAPEEGGGGQDGE